MVASNFATETLSHFEKVRGDMGIAGKCVGVWGRCGKRYERRCRKVCWGVGEVRGDVGKGEGREMWGSVLGPHTQTHFPTPLPTCQHTSPLTPYTLPHFSTPHTPQHTSLHLHPHTSSHSSLHLPLGYTPIHFPLTPCIFPQIPHSFEYVAKLYHLTMSS